MEEGISPVPPCLTPTLPPDTLRLNTSKPPGHPFIHTKKNGTRFNEPRFSVITVNVLLRMRMPHAIATDGSSDPLDSTHYSS